MAVIKVACPKCGQRVSGDESFYGTTVECPVCTSTIRFPGDPQPTKDSASAGSSRPQVPPSSPTVPKAEKPPTTSEPPARRETSAIPLPPRQKPASSPTDAGEPAELPSPVMGVVSMVLGLVSVMLFCAPGILFGPAAIICGHLARARARHSPVASPPGHGAALIGLILGYLSLIGFIVLIAGLKPAVEWIRETRPPQ